MSNNLENISILNPNQDKTTGELLVEGHLDVDNLQLPTEAELKTIEAEERRTQELEELVNSDQVNGIIAAQRNIQDADGFKF